MTPQFTTACYVRVDDKDKRNEVYARLEKMGYKSTLSAEHNSWGNLIVVRRYGVIQNTGIEYGELPKHLIDCGHNIELFLSLTGMRSDTDMEQYFIDERDGSINFSEDDDIGLSALVYRKATATEIVEHFNKLSK